MNRPPVLSDSQFEAIERGYLDRCAERRLRAVRGAPPERGGLRAAFIVVAVVLMLSVGFAGVFALVLGLP